MIRTAWNTGFAFGSGWIPAKTFWLWPNSSGRPNSHGLYSTGIRRIHWHGGSQQNTLSTAQQGGSHLSWSITKQCSKLVYL